MLGYAQWRFVNVSLEAVAFRLVSGFEQLLSF
jgi:hypothetical protein